MTSPELERARAAKQKAKAVLTSHQVTGIGLASRHGTYFLKVLLSAQLCEQDPQPEDIDGVPLEYQVVGVIRPQGKPGRSA